jgi:hypothetical protein
MTLAGTEVPAKMVIIHPITGVPMMVKRPEAEEAEEAYLMVLSGESKVARQYDREMMDRRVNARRRPTAAEMEEENLVKLAKLVGQTKDWLICDPDGNYIDEPCNEGNARELLASARWLFQQVTEFADNRINFVKS